MLTPASCDGGGGPRSVARGTGRPTQAATRSVECTLSWPRRPQLLEKWEKWPGEGDGGSGVGVTGATGLSCRSRHSSHDQSFAGTKHVTGGRRFGVRAALAGAGRSVVARPAPDSAWQWPTTAATAIFCRGNSSVKRRNLSKPEQGDLREEGDAPLLREEYPPSTLGRCRAVKGGPARTLEASAQL